MKKDKQKIICHIHFSNNDFIIKATAHSILRMRQRKIDEYVVAGTFLSLRPKLLEYHKNDRDVAIIDKVNGIAVIATFEKMNTIKVITVIDKKDIWVKDGTSIVNVF